jgi:hypothetical protein
MERRLAQPRRDLDWRDGRECRRVLLAFAEPRQAPADADAAQDEIAQANDQLTQIVVLLLQSCDRRIRHLGPRPKSNCPLHNWRRWRVIWSCGPKLSNIS